VPEHPRSRVPWHGSRPVTEGDLILIAGLLMATALAASLLARRVRLPGLVLFLAIGMLIGSDGTGWIDFNDYELARNIGVVALILILFEGGLAASFNEIRPVLAPAASLATVGTVAAAVISGFAAAWLFDFSLLEGMLLGSVVAATDAAAVFSVLRGSTLRRRLARTLEGESGFNDPVAVLLVLGFIDWIEKPGYGFGDMAIGLVGKLVVGLVIGLAVGQLAVWAFRRMRLESAGLYPVASLTSAALAFGVAEVLHGSGFLAVYLTGLALGSAPIPARRTVEAFHEGMAWVAQLGLFLALGLLVFPSQLGDVALEGTALAFVLVFVARPISTALATAPFGFGVSEQLALGWAGLRGAVPVVLATFPVIAGVGGSLDFFNIVFFAVLLSTVLQGATFEPFARWLNATTDEPALPATPVDVGMIRQLGAEILEFRIGEGDAAVGAYVRELGLPRDALVTAIIRGDQAVAPRGAMRVRADDRLQVLVPGERTQEIVALADSWRDGPVGPPPRPRRLGPGIAPLFSARPWADADGNPSEPVAIGDQPVVERLRQRRDRPGALVLLADGRYALTGSLVVVGGREALIQWARDRIRVEADDEERAWLRGAVGTLASDQGLPP
jgi:cell volume regulation protein A